MVEIISHEGEVFKYDQANDRIYKDGYVLSSTIAEPVFSDVNGASRFTGIFLKPTNQILTLSGKKNYVSNINAVE